MTLSKITSLLLLVGLGACAKVPTNNDEEILDKRQQRYAGMGSILGDEGIVFGGPKKNDGGGQGTGIGVNAYLWRATLDTLSFMPLKSADPFGGVIITDWYSSPSAPQERMKVDVVILDRQLRADGLRISAFRQELKKGIWVDVATDSSVVTSLENSILTKARSMRAKGA